MKLFFLSWINKSFSTKVFVYLLGAMIIVAVSFSFVSLQFQQENFEQELMKDGRVLSSVLAGNARLGIFAEDRNQIAASLRNAVKVEGIIGACAYNAGGDLLYRESIEGWAHTGVCLDADKVSDDFLLQLRKAESVYYLEDKKTFEFWSPVYARTGGFSEEGLYFRNSVVKSSEKSSLIGIVGLVYDKGLIQHSIREMLTKNTLILSLFLLVGSFAAYYIVLTVTSPLKQLIRRIKNTQGLHTESGDELGLLTDTFSNMVDTLNDSFETINDLKKGLEKNVEELQKEINTRRKTEKALRESEEKFRSISEGIAEGVAIIQDRKFVWCNKAFGGIFGYGPKQLIGKNTDSLFDLTLQQTLDKVTSLKLPVKPEGFTYKFSASHKDGHSMVLDSKASESIFEGQAAVEIILRDITNRENAEKAKKELEIKALSQSKLAAIGEIATGIAHEINQPLTFIKIVYQSTLRDLAGGQCDRDSIEKKFTQALQQVERITAITEHLRSFGRSDISVFSPMNLPIVLDNTMILLGERLRLRNLTLVQEIEDNLPQVNGNKMQLEQVFINLFQNSINAMANSNEGKIKVRMSRRGDFLETVFADTGPGIDEAISKRIFEPFFTTRKPEEGIGLGLAIASNIIKEHYGTISYQQEPGWGATFIILLPVLENQEESVLIGN